MEGCQAATHIETAVACHVLDAETGAFEIIIPNGSVVRHGPEQGGADYVDIGPTVGGFEVSKQTTRMNGSTGRHNEVAA